MLRCTCCPDEKSIFFRGKEMRKGREAHLMEGGGRKKAMPFIKRKKKGIGELPIPKKKGKKRRVVKPFMKFEEERKGG